METEKPDSKVTFVTDWFGEATRYVEGWGFVQKFAKRELLDAETWVQGKTITIRLEG